MRSRGTQNIENIEQKAEKFGDAGILGFALLCLAFQDRSAENQPGGLASVRARRSVPRPKQATRRHRSDLRLSGRWLGSPVSMCGL